MKVLLLDRDGVIVRDPGYNYDPAAVQLLPGVGKALKKLSGWKLFVVSNQSGIARGFGTIDALDRCNDRMKELLAKDGVTHDDVVYCPHQPDDKCGCRKPQTGMWEALKKKHGLDASTCVMIGDKPADVQFGQNIGCVTAFVKTSDADTGADYVVKDLPELVGALLRHDPFIGKVMTADEAAQFAESARKAGKTVVTTNGAFDLLHDGHRFLFDEVRKLGDVFIVGVNADATVRKNKGPGRPVEPEAVRALNVSRHADAVFVFSDPDPRAWLPLIKPNIHANAETYGKDCVEAQTVKDIGATLALIPVEKELGSTTEILRRRNA